MKISFANKVRLFFLTLSLVGLLVSSMSSCTSTRGYGCKGNGSGMGYVGYK